MSKTYQSIPDLQAEVKKLREDKKIVDWIENRGTYLQFSVSGPGPQATVGIYSLSRADILAAMETYQ